MNQPTQDIKPKILVIRFGAMGDLIHVSPSIEKLREHLPKSEIHLLTSPIYKELAEQFPYVHTVWTFDKKSGWGSLLKLAQTLKQEQFDTVINLHPSLRTILLARFIQPSEVKTYKKERIQTKGEGQRKIERKHAIEDFYQPFVRAFNLPMSTIEALKPNLSSSKEKSSPIIGIIPGVGSKRSNRSWGKENYTQLVPKLLTQYPDHQIHLFGGPDEKPLAEDIIQNVTANNPSIHNKITSFCGTLSILETKDALSQCALVIGGDTGPLHLAAATGVTILGLFAPTSVKRTGAIGLGNIQHVTPLENLDCWPCEEPVCPFSGNKHLACMEQITPETILQYTSKYLN